MTIIKNDKNELIHTNTVTRWKMIIDYRMMNQTTRKDRPFIIQGIDA